VRRVLILGGRVVDHAEGQHSTNSVLHGGAFVVEDVSQIDVDWEHFAPRRTARFMAKLI